MATAAIASHQYDVLPPNDNACRKRSLCPARSLIGHGRLLNGGNSNGFGGIPESIDSRF